MAKVLLVEDDHLVAEAVKDCLTLSNHVFDWAKDGQEGIDRLLLYDYDLAILDWNLPRLDGIDVCKRYRARGGTVPVLMLTGRSAEFEKVQGLDSGADDYLTKPFSLAELSARVRALLRRPRTTLSETIEWGSLVIDLRNCRVTRGGAVVELVPKEMALLEFLLRNRNQSFTVTDLLDRVWSSESDSTEDAVRQCITRLRKKIDVDGQPSLITTVRGVGYRIEG